MTNRNVRPSPMMAAFRIFLEQREGYERPVEGTAQYRNLLRAFKEGWDMAPIKKEPTNDQRTTA